MQFKELGTQNVKTMVLLPGTGCTWELNFMNVVDDLSKKYHLICVNYDGFETDISLRTNFTDILTIVSKIEEYISYNFYGKVDAVYGSSLGGTLAALLVARKNIYVTHCFIGGSDLDESGKVFARIMADTVGAWFENSLRDEKKSEKFKEKIKKMATEEDTDSETSVFIDGFVKTVRDLNPGTVKREFYSDYITRLPNNISVPGSIIHVIYAEKMGPKYERRYLSHFKNPDIRRFNMQHEEWLFKGRWKQKVLDTIDECMSMHSSK